MPITIANTFGTGVALPELVSIRRRFLRSVNLERDFYSTAPLDGYVLTPSALQAIDRIALAFEQPYARALTLTGAYGTGKSACALFASKLLSAPSAEQAALAGRLRRSDPALAQRLEVTGTGFWPILLTGTRSCLSRALVDGLFTGLRRLPRRGAKGIAARLERAFPAVLGSTAPSAKEVTALYEAAARAVQQKGCSASGLLLVVDEMGKFLEYAATHPESGDLLVLQELAELAARSVKAPFLFITILHQAFEEYALRLGQVQRQEWQKVQGRFHDLPFGDNPDEVMNLVAKAIAQRDAPEAEGWISDAIDRQVEWCRQLQIMPPHCSVSEYRQLLRNAYPLHPLALRLLPHLFQRFGQNERSLFSFLSSEDPFGFQAFLRDHRLSPEQVPFLPVDYLYDYVVSTLGSSLYSHPTAKLWSEAAESLYRLRDVDPIQSRLVKTIALLHIVGEQTKALPSRPVLGFALEGAGVTSHEVERAIDALEAATIITYRQFKKAYRLYEGSDVDVEARLREAKTFFIHGTDVLRVAASLEAFAPLVARRHSFERGTFRTFAVRYCRSADIADELQTPNQEADGLLLVCLVYDRAERQEAVERLEGALASRPDVILGFCQESEALHEAAVAVECLRWVQENTPELRNDKVARREVDERLLEAQDAFSAEWERLLRPERAAGETNVWLYRGVEAPVANYRQLQELVSAACDIAYCHTPYIRNELINRRQLSSTAAAARGELIKALLSKHREARLGISGSPPHYSMYVSVLKSTGIHAPSGTDGWGIEPPTRDAGLRAVWETMETWLYSFDLRPRAVSSLFELLKAPPFGLSDGILPILLCALLIRHAGNVGLYEEGALITDLDSGDIERLIKHPGEFALQACQVTGERQAVLERFGRGLLKDGETATVMNVARALYREFRRLPDFTGRTSELGEKARQLRDLLKASSEPERLLFIDLPELFGCMPFSAEEEEPGNVARFFTAWNEAYGELMEAYPNLLKRIEGALFVVFAIGEWTELRLRAAVILPYITEPRLHGFVLRAADETLERGKWLESVATTVMERPPSGWGDQDLPLLENRLLPLASAFHHSLQVAFEKKRQVSGEEQVGMRIAVTLDTGAEAVQVVVVPRSESERIEALASTLLEDLDRYLGAFPRELRLAIVAKALQRVLEGGGDEGQS